MIEDIYEMKNVYIICLRASNGEFFRIRRKIYKDKAYWKELEEEPTC